MRRTLWLRLVILASSCGGGGGSGGAGTVSLSSAPAGTQGSVLAIDQTKGVGYVLLAGTPSSVAVVDIASSTVTKTLPLAGTQASAIACDSSTGLVYVAGTQGTFPNLQFGVSTLDPSSGSFTFTNNDAGAVWMDVDESNHTVYAWTPGPDPAGTDLYVIDGTNDSVTASLTTPGYLYPGIGSTTSNGGQAYGGGGIAVDSATHKVFLFGSAPFTGTQANALLTILDGTTNTVVGTPQAIVGYPMSIDFDSTNDTPIYATQSPNAAVDAPLSLPASVTSVSYAAQDCWISDGTGEKKCVVEVEVQEADGWHTLTFYGGGPSDPGVDSHTLDATNFAASLKYWKKATSTSVMHKLVVLDGYVPDGSGGMMLVPIQTLYTVNTHCRS
jgi:hypothetical protein